jgi:hypothetical protein
MRGAFYVSVTLPINLQGWLCLVLYDVTFFFNFFSQSKQGDPALQIGDPPVVVELGQSAEAVNQKTPEF